MKWTGLGEEPCPIARALDVIGDRWTVLVLRDCFLGVRRFDGFLKRIGMPRAALAQRLSALVEAGVLMRQRYSERPERHEYRLTEKGLALHPVLMTMAAWSNAHAFGTEDLPVLHVHRGCGQVTEARLHCNCCGEAIGPRDIDVLPGAGHPDAPVAIRSH